MSDSTHSLDYIRDPAEIYRRSFAIVRAETDLSGLPPDLADLAVRLVHSCGMPDIVPDLAWSADLATAVKAALESGAEILCDTRMVAEGIIPRRLPAGNRVTCSLYEPAVIALAGEQKTTRAAATVEYWLPRLGGAVVVIGNAPTALFRLIELLQAGAPRPAAIIGIPVGFVGAAESKEALIAAAAELGIPYLTVRGRRGGSALAAAAVNALGKHVA